MQGRWAGRNRGTACAQREPEIFKASPGHECRVNTKKYSSFSPADLLDSTAALKNSAHSPAAVRPMHSEVLFVWGTKSILMCLSTSTAPASWPLAGGEPHTPAFFWPGPACCCELLNIPGSPWLLQGGTYSPTPPLHTCQGCQCCMQCDRTQGLRGFDLLTWHIPQSSAWDGQSFHTNLVAVLSKNQSCMGLLSEMWYWVTVLFILNAFLHQMVDAAFNRGVAGHFIRRKYYKYMQRRLKMDALIAEPSRLWCNMTILSNHCIDNWPINKLAGSIAADAGRPWCQPALQNVCKCKTEMSLFELCHSYT